MMVKAFSLNPESILSQRKMVDPELLAKAHDMTESLLTHPEVEEPGGYDPNVDGPDREAFEAARRNGE
jgi:hypothetical protein